MKLLLTTIAAVVLVGTAFADPIHDAVNRGDLAGVQAELDKGANVNAKMWRRTPLHSATAGGHTEIAELLIDNGADVNANEDYGWTPLHLAAKYGHREVAELLIAKDADMNAKKKDGWTPLHLAALYGHKEIVELLIAKGAGVNAKSEWGDTPLDWAASVDEENPPETKTAKREIADFLRKHGGKTGEELKASVPRLSFIRSPFGFTFDTIEGNTYRVESGSDLKNWNKLREINGTGNEAKFIDVRRIYFPQHFYRVVVED